MEIKLSPSKYTAQIKGKEIVRNFFDFNWGSAVADIINVNDSIETKAFSLVFKSVRETNYQLSKEFGQEILNKTLDLVTISLKTADEVKNFLQQEVLINKDFFENPLSFNNDYIFHAYKTFEKFCSLLNIPLPNNIRLTYYEDFRNNLASEFQNNREYYKELLDFFDNPIIQYNNDFSAMLEYYNAIKSYFTNNLQSDGESEETLRDLYIDPFFKIYRSNLTKKFLEEQKDKTKSNTDFFDPTNNISLHSFFNEYFFRNKKIDELKDNYDMVFLLGQPGQGKTSCCYKLVYDYLENSHDLPSEKIFFVKIRDLVAEDFVKNPLQEASKKVPKFVNLENEEGYLILDGLDEAYMSGGVNESDLRNLYERLKKRTNKKLKILLTSRYSYLQVTDSCLDNTLIINLASLTDEQILDYSKKFEQFYPESNFAKQIDKIIEHQKYGHIKELLQQAVLIYFIGVSNIDIEERDSKAKIYDKIFDAMAQRSWDKSGQLDYLSSKMKDNPDSYKKHLREYLCNLAFEIYQSPNLYITLGHLNSLETTKNFVKKCFRKDIQDSEDNIKEINKYLLISFYFQESANNKTNETAIEFFHNSLFEYLTAEFFWNENKSILLNEDEDGDLVSISYKRYFFLLDYLVGNKEINGAVLRNLIEIIENESCDVNDKIVLQMEELFYHLLKKDFLLKYDANQCLLTSREKTEQLINLSWTFLHTSNKNLSKRLQLPDEFSKIFKDDIFDFRDLVNVKFGRENGTLIIDRPFFYHSKIINSQLQNCHAEITIIESTISETVFDEIDFYDYHLRKNTFEKVIFKNCDFSSKRCYIEDNNFIETVFDEILIESEEWYKDFISNNTFDEWSLERMEFVSRNEIDHTEKSVVNYYIVEKKQ